MSLTNILLIVFRSYQKVADIDQRLKYQSLQLRYTLSTTTYISPTHYVFRPLDKAFFFFFFATFTTSLSLSLCPVDQNIKQSKNVW